MRNMVLGLVLATSGCSSAASALGGVISPKPPSVTVVTNVEPGAQPSRAEAPAKRRGFFEKVGIVTTSTLVGAGLGALAGDALDADIGAAALLGATAGGMAGVAIAKD